MSASAGRSGNQLRRVAARVASRLPWFVDAYRFVRKPGWELVLWRDLARTRSSARSLRELPGLPSDAPVALVGLYRDNVFDTKTALLLATALRLPGLRPVVTMPTNRSHRVRRYARAFGIDRVIAQDQLRLAPGVRDEIALVHAQLLAGDHDFEAIKAWTFHGHQVGSHVLSTLIRVTFDGSPDLDVNRERLDAIVDDVLTNTARAERLMDELSPQVVLVEEANYSVNGPLVDVAVARGIDVIQTIPLWRDDALMSKRLTSATRRIDAKSVAPETLARLTAEPWTAAHDEELDGDFADRYGGRWTMGRQSQPDTTTRSDEQIVAELSLDPNRRTAVIFAHVLWDASLFFGVDLFANYSDWLVQSIRQAIENRNVNWVVKAHPSNVFRVARGDVAGESSEVTLVRDHFPKLPDHVHLLLPETKISTLSLYRFADYGVTVRGTPGMEIACFGKPAFTAGTGTYAGLGFTYDSRSRQEFLERLATIHEYEPISSEATMQARRYAHTLFTRRPWIPRSFELVYDFPANGWHPLDRNVNLRVRTTAGLERAGDLTSWAQWALDTEDPDYLPEPAT